MSLKRFMHKRNIYRDEPNFKQLAILYPEFRKVAVTDIAGKVRINFKDEKSLRVLTKVLLKHDFNLCVEIPEKKLVPALTLRLNYILWIEDLLKHCGIQDMSKVTGLDIGAGAICIYPLLLHKMYNCNMVCTEIDPESIKTAKKNIELNNYQDFIQVVQVKTGTVLTDVLSGEKNFTFVMCNPPFFKTDKGLGKKSKVTPPRNAPTGYQGELEVEGGERNFILQLITESLEYKNKVKIFTTMFGQKSSLGFLRSELIKKGITNATWTEFCQGFTKRWGIVWTFLPKEELNLSTAPVIRTRSEILKAKRDKSVEIIFPPREKLSSVDEVKDLIKQWLSELNVEVKIMDMDDELYPCWACQLTAYSDTWSHARRKRRLAMRLHALAKKPELDTEQSATSEDNPNSQHVEDRLKIEDIASKDEKKQDPLLVCTLVIAGTILDLDEDDTDEDDEINRNKLKLCLFYESGHGGKQTLETLRQYFVNKLNVREFFCKQKVNKAKTKKKKRKNLMEPKESKSSDADAEMSM